MKGVNLSSSHASTTRRTKVNKAICAFRSENAEETGGSACDKKSLHDEQTVPFTTSEIGKLANRQKHMKTGNENREDEENISKLDYELSSYGDLLIKAVEPVRGQGSISVHFLNFNKWDRSTGMEYLTG
ncbi:unnamed protein product [Onchocerca flexuosa]|uniref:RRM domain-containing protein n=1 Tax=Onchocerca flexuosa TaxID=387005 RepID=A0A183HGG9_9BILA|nr:unnamed protein product [Onchocerca flexuosa]